MAFQKMHTSGQAPYWARLVPLRLLIPRSTATARRPTGSTKFLITWTSKVKRSLQSATTGAVLPHSCSTSLSGAFALVTRGFAYQVLVKNHFSLWMANYETASRLDYLQSSDWELSTALHAPELLCRILEKFWETNSGWYPSLFPE